MRKNWMHMNKVWLVSFLLAVVTTVTGLSFAAFAENTAGNDIEAVKKAVKSFEKEFPIDLSNMVENDNSTGKDSRELPAAVNPDQKPFWVYSNYIDFSPILLTSVFYGRGVTYFVVEVSKDGRTYDQYWKPNDAPFAYYDGRYKIGGLTPDKVYYVRLRATDMFGRYDNGVFYNTKVHTGKPKLQVKSISMKAVKVKRHSRTYYYYGWFYKSKIKEYWYTYKIKVTVKMKKKPGTPGVFINNEWVKGNKKTYKITLPKSGYFTYNSKKSPKHRKKFFVGVYSAFSKEYGGCSPLKYKNKKIS